MNDQRVENFHANIQNYEVDANHQLNFHKNEESMPNVIEPFHIKTEQEDKNPWNSHHSYVDNENNVNSSMNLYFIYSATRLYSYFIYIFFYFILF